MSMLIYFLVSSAYQLAPFEFTHSALKRLESGGVTLLILNLALCG